MALVLQTKDLRENKKLTIAKLSKLSGVSRSYLTEMEQQKYDNPTLNVICALCKALECTPNDLIPEELYRRDKK